MLLLDATPLALTEALALGPALLACEDALAAHGAALAAAVLDEPDPALVLGAQQRRGAVLRSPSLRAERRASAGAECYVAGVGVWFALALDGPAALAADARPETLLNRNVRGFLRGLGRDEGPALYFGRDALVLAKRPFAPVGFEATQRGAVLLEVYVPLERPAWPPPEALESAARERAERRLRGAEPRAFGPVDGGPEALARRVFEAHARQWRVGLARDEALAARVLDDARARAKRRPEEREEGAVLARGAVPAGLVEVLRAAGPEGGLAALRIATDALAPTFALRALEAHVAASEAGSALPDVVRDAPLEGARWGELEAVLRSAL